MDTTGRSTFLSLEVSQAWLDVTLDGKREVVFSKLGCAPSGFTMVLHVF